MIKRDIGNEILEGIKEIKAHKDGRITLITRKLKEPSSTKSIRSKLNLSQSEFAALMGVSTRTVQDWEQGRREQRDRLSHCFVLQNSIRKFFLKSPNISQPVKQAELRLLQCLITISIVYKPPTVTIFYISKTLLLSIH